MDPELKRLQDLASPVGDKQLPPIFLGELAHFDWSMETCEMPNGMQGARIVISPGLLPFIKLSLPFYLPSLEKFYADVAELLVTVQRKDAPTPEG